MGKIKVAGIKNMLPFPLERVGDDWCHDGDHFGDNEHGFWDKNLQSRVPDVLNALPALLRVARAAKDLRDAQLIGDALASQANVDAALSAFDFTD